MSNSNESSSWRTSHRTYSNGITINVNGDVSDKGGQLKLPLENVDDRINKAIIKAFKDLVDEFEKSMFNNVWNKNEKD